jgi:Tfp pilus assembly protein PilF
MAQSESFENSENLFREAIKAEKKDRLGEAIRLLRQVLIENPSHAGASEQLGWLLYGSGESLEEPRRLLEEAVRLDPQSGDSHLYLGIVLGKLWEPDLADFHFNRAIVLTDLPAFYRGVYGNYLAEDGRLTEAEHELSTAVDLDPNCNTTIRDYARLLTVLGRDGEADAYFYLAVSLDPEDKWSNYHYGEFLALLEGREKEALDYLRRAVALDPAYKAAQNGLKALIERMGPP